MRILKKGFVILGILTLGLVRFDGQSLLYHPNFVQAQTLVTLPVSLREFVKVTLKSKEAISGLRLVEINSNTQQIRFEQDRKSVNLNIAKIESLEFSGRAKLKDGTIVMRGEENSSNCSNSEILNLPLNAFSMKDSSQAELTISSLAKRRQDVIEQINELRTFVIDEIKFETQSKITIKTTPCSKNP